MSDATVSRTPVIVLSNNDIFPKEPAFRNRMYTYHWRTANLLKSIALKPHPIGFYRLLIKYNIFDDIE